MTIAYNIFKGRCPAYLNDLVTLGTGLEITTSAFVDDHVRRRTRTLFDRRPFSVSEPYVWNSLSFSVGLLEANRLAFACSC